MWIVENVYELVYGVRLLKWFIIKEVEILLVKEIVVGYVMFKLKVMIILFDG